MLVEKNNNNDSIETMESLKVEFIEPKVKLILMEKCDVIATSGDMYMNLYGWDPVEQSSDKEDTSIPD